MSNEGARPIRRSVPAAHAVGYTGPRDPRTALGQIAHVGAALLACAHVEDWHTPVHVFERACFVRYERTDGSHATTKLIALCLRCFFKHRGEPEQAPLDGELHIVGAIRTPGLQ